MRDKDEWQPVPQLARYARSNLVLHLQGPVLPLPPVLSLPSEERYGVRRGENATVQHSPPVDVFRYPPETNFASPRSSLLQNSTPGGVS